MKEIQEITISPLKANVMALVIVMPFLVVFYLPFLFIYGKEKVLQGFLKLDLVFPKGLDRELKFGIFADQLIPKIKVIMTPTMIDVTTIRSIIF